MSLINVDLDGVVYPYHEVFAEYLNDKLGDVRPFDVEAITEWAMWKCWGFESASEWSSWFKRGVEDGYIWHKGEPIENARETLWKLSDDGHTLRVVTTRLAFKGNHAAIIGATVEWLDRANIPYHDIAFVGKTSKGTYNADYAIDDNYDNCMSYASESDVQPFLFKRPWNQEHGYLEWGGWKEFYDFVK